MSFNLDNIESKKGNVAIVTGANSGLGKEITIGLTKKDVKVIMACRNIEKAQKAKSEILETVETADIEIMQLDLSSLKSVRSFAKSYIEKYDKLNYLVENAGIMIPPFSLTEDGFESQMGANYFGHFLLTNLLMPILLKTEEARIATTSSIAHVTGKIDFDNLNAEKTYSKSGAYGQSKLACLMFGYELQRRLDKANCKNIISVSSHPGVSKTNLFNNIPMIGKVFLLPFVPFFSHSPRKAALPMLASLFTDVLQGGEYFGPTGFNGMIGKPGIIESKPHSYDEEVAKKLWEVSEKLTGEKFEV